jgi:lysophospholipase L1-like esterase
VLLFARARLARPSGEQLNRLAWEATFRERGLPVPPDGPRDGYWGQRMPRVVEDAHTGWREAEAHLPRLVESGADGIQWAGSDDKAARRLAIVGASVAWGAYASSLDSVYFSRLASKLGASVGPTRIAVVAAGAWDSENELRAFRARVLPLRPQVVVLLNGLNDLTNSAARRRRRVGWPEVPEAERVERYLGNMTALRDEALRAGVTPVYAPQPFLLQKRRKTPLEQRVLELSLGKELSERSLEAGFGEVRRGLLALCAGGRAHCLDVAGVFDAERATTFTDMWHFTDPGHVALADALARQLAPILEATPPR